MQSGIGAFIGTPPVVTVGLTERKKYEQMWSHPEYRAVAPGEEVAQTFLLHAHPPKGAEVIDFGAGTGRGALALAFFGGVKVNMLDFAENCLDEDVRNALTTQSHVLTFRVHDLLRPVPISAPYGFCTDVMEHIPPNQVTQVLGNILKAAQHVFFQISCVPDSCGKLIGHDLHLTVRPFSWWLTRLQELGCLIHWSQDCGESCLFYVTSWQDGRALVKEGELNTAENELLNNVRANVEAGWQECTPHVTNDQEVMILGGGPSLNDFEADIKRRRLDGAKLVTLNGTYHWAIERGLTPSAQIVIDGRPFNARFTKPVVDHCKYLLASQVHPTCFEGLPPDRTYIWHTTWKEVREIVKAKRDAWYGIPGGSTTMLRAIPLLRMLGFRKFHLYGFDSCMNGEAHHAYPQAENDGQPVANVTCAGRVFRCTLAQCCQAQEFMDLVRFIGNEIELEVHGDGLIAHILRHGAALADGDLVFT